MKSRFTTFIMSLIIILIIAVLILFAIILFDDFAGTEIANGVQNFVSTVTSIGEEEENLSTPGIIETDIEQLESSSTNNYSANYENVVIDDYFYNQLEEPAKIFYRAFESNKENMKTGTYKIEFGDVFSDILKNDGGDNLLGNYYQSAVETYIYDHPEVFYLDVNKMYLNIETTTKFNKVTYNVFVDNGSQPSYLEDGFSSKEEVDAYVTEIEAVKDVVVSKKTGNVYKDVKMVHDYIVDETSYDTTISKPNIYNIYGTLVSEVSVCEGYAKSFKYLMDSLGIPCVIVIGTATNSSGESENHAWNYVQIDDSWYAVDSTWDDPVVVGGGKQTQSSRYQYFLKGKSTMNKDHFPDGEFTEDGKIYEYPTLSNSDYNI